MKTGSKSMGNGTCRRQGDHMNGGNCHRRRVWRWGIAVVALVMLGACKEQQTAGPRFTLAAGGLPSYGMWKSSPVLADVNGDGLPDLAVHSRLTDGVRVWLNDGKGGWRDASTGLSHEVLQCGGGLDMGDVNRDGKLDLVVADHCSGVFVFLGDGMGHWELAAANLAPTITEQPDIPKDEVEYFRGAESVAVGDVNRDGFPDIVAGASDRGGFTVYFGDGSGKHWEEARADGLPSWDDPEVDDDQKGGWAPAVLLRDMDGDGHLDVVASYYLGPRVWRNDGKGRFEPRSQGLPQPSIGGLFWRVVVADVNGDGRPDLAAANSVNGPEVFLQNADGSWRQVPDMMPTLKGGALAVALGDLDQDGRGDLVVGGRTVRTQADYELFVLRGDGQGGFTEVEVGLPKKGVELTWGITLGDVNNDGRQDIVAATGSTTTKKGRGKLPLRSSEPAPEEKLQPETVGNASLPHLQVWLNQK